MKKTVDNGESMKLNIKRTLTVGFAFMGIMCFWEVYDYIMPLILVRMFGMSSSGYGLIMGLDNLLSIFLLPVFGHLSDRAVKAKYGRRTTFIFWGTIAAIICLLALTFIEYSQYQKVIAGGIENLENLVKSGLDPKFLTEPYTTLAASGGKGLDASSLIQYNEFLSAKSSAQLVFAASVRKANPQIIISFIGVLLLLLVAMTSYRSPAVALMPDVTPKPVRSQANALITLMGGIGGLVSILLYKFLATKRYQSHIALFCTLAGMMIFMLLAYLATVRENKYVNERVLEEKKWNVVDEEELLGQEKLSKEKLISLLLILGTVFLWFMGFNAVKSHLSVYATDVLHFKDGVVGTINIINGLGGAIALLPVALMAAKLGRKKTILIGLVFAALAFVPCFFMTANTPNVKIWFPLCFILSGFGLVCVNVNTFPMVTELSKGSNVGKYTGFYYISSMLAQSVTPFISGLFMDKLQKNLLFVYSIIFIVLAMVTIICTKHGDNKPKAKAKIVEYFGEED